MAANENDIAKSASVFVIVGFIQGILLITADYVSGIFFHQDLVIAIVLLMLVLSNGDFTLTGLRTRLTPLPLSHQVILRRIKKKGSL